MLHLSKIEEILGQELSHILKHSSETGQATLTTDQLMQMLTCAYMQGLDDVLAILRNSKTMSAAGEMIAQALEEHFKGEMHE